MANVKEKKKAFISAVIYVHNCEKETLFHFCDKVLRHLKETFEEQEAVFVVDGHEENGETQIRQILSELALQVTACVVQFPYFQGMEAAIGAGDDLAVGDFVFEFDDVSAEYDVELLDQVFEKISGGYDIVSAGDDSMNLSSRLFYGLINHGKKEKLHHETFRVVSRRALNRIKILNKTVPYRKILYATCGLPGTFIEYQGKKAGHGGLSTKQKNYRLDSGFKYMIIYTQAVEKLTMFLSMIFLLAAVGTGAWAIYDHFYGNAVAGGWVSLMAVISFGFFGLFLLLMVIIKYLSLLIAANYKKADYVVEKVEKL